MVKVYVFRSSYGRLRQMTDETSYRKLQVTGGSTFIVSLPKEWVRTNKLAQGDPVGIETMQSGQIQISPTTLKKQKRLVTIKLDNLNAHSLFDHLIGAYVSGCDGINLVSNKNIHAKYRRIIRNFLRDTRGMEITIDEEKNIEIVSLLNPTELPLQVSLNRMYLLLTSLVEDSISTMVNGDMESLSDYEDREKHIDARRLLVDRQVAMCLVSPSVQRSLGLDRYQAMEHANMARSMERMGDHAMTLARMVYENHEVLPWATDSLPFKQIPIWSNAFRTIIRNTYNKKMDSIHESKRELEEAIKDLSEYESSLWEKNSPPSELLFQYRFSEVVRRLCGYSIDLAETLINMLMASKSVNVDAEKIHY
tara:strand:+ start:790 stop:1884 length:1095 start_codon:yes stop_codon:yes gene_type:complete